MKMKRAIVLIVLAMYGIMAAFCNSYKYKAQTGETRTRKDGTTFHVWDRMDLSERRFNELLNTDFKNARVVKHEDDTKRYTNYSIEKDGKQIVITDIEDK